ncbi:MFS transporter [Aerococcus sp. UMB7834]|uniref:MFS transporter n=1 Tax=Aerococcus sp. UMB7834 TaxID=3046342 RepID=UPI00254A4CDE|nr:MFS transporter [Aerococcus sp. UMB7834]MDK6804782.1 MFS transporter [Aerococcus sp. UMB7834]
MAKLVLEDAKYHRAKPWEIALFSMNNSASNLYLFAFGFLTYYATGVAGLTTLLVSSVLGMARLFDGIIDPTIGFIIDNFNTRWGKYRPIMLVSNIGLILSFLMIFNLHNLSGTAQTVMLFISLIFHKIVYSFQQTVTKAAQSALTNDPEQRPLFTLFDTVFSGIGVFSIGQYIVSNLLLPQYQNEYNGDFFTVFIPGICVVSLVLTILAMIGLSRKDQTRYFGLGHEEDQKLSLRDVWSIIKGNRPLQILAVCGGFVKFVAQLIGDQTFLVLLFGIILADMQLVGQVSLYLIIPQFIMIAIFTRIAGKKGLKFTYQTSIILALAAWILMTVLFASTTDTTQLFSPAGFLAYCFLGLWICARIFSVYPTSIVLTMSADITDYETSRTGKYAAGVIGTIFSLTDSIASSLSPIVLGLVFAGIGYVDGFPQPNEPLNPALMQGGYMLLGIIIAVFVVTAILIRFYPLDPETMEEVQAKIAAKKAQKANETA